jgi:hypothetical protein
MGGHWAIGGRDGEDGGLSSEGQNLSGFLKANRIFHPCKVEAPITDKIREFAYVYRCFYLNQSQVTST